MKQAIPLMFVLLCVVSLVSAAQVGSGLNNVTNETQLRITINNPVAIFSVNKSDVISYYIEFTNKNDFPLDINVTSDDKNLNFTSSTHLLLMPNDTLSTTYDITAVESKDVVINAQFTGNGKSFGASQRITIRLVKSNFDSNLILYIGIPAVILIAIIVIYFVVRHNKKRLRLPPTMPGADQVMPDDVVTHP